MRSTLHWTDTNRNITNKIYELNSGAKLVEAVNPGSIETYISFAFGGGYIHEHAMRLPIGTAHFLEHIMAGNPNKVFKNKKTLDDFKKGNLDKAKIWTNATTSWRLLEFYGYTHHTALKRLLKFLFAEIDYPLDRLEEFIEKERGIILSEYYGKDKKEKSTGIAYDKFFFGSTYGFVGEYVLGNEDSIKQISTADLTTYYNNVITADNLVISIQHPKPLTKAELKSIEEFTNKLAKGKLITFKAKKIPNKFKYYAFQKEDTNDIFFSVNRFEPTNPKVDYKESVLDFFYNRVISELTFKKLREEKNLIYAGGNNIGYPGIKLKNYYFNSSVRIENFKIFLDELYELFEHGIEDFLTSKESDSWFLSEQSTYIYRFNQNYDPDYAVNIGADLLFKQDPVFDFNNCVPIAKDLTKKDLLNYFKKISSIEPGFWFVSPLPKEDVENAFKESKLFKKYQK
ncbi:hypothetical protein DOJK_00414 [Patescibacteria group bacterium]|nr:hypothetical protein DOJK_00414 [Patescibacteria group bacterium]